MTSVLLLASSELTAVSTCLCSFSISSVYAVILLMHSVTCLIYGHQQRRAVYGYLPEKVFQRVGIICLTIVHLLRLPPSRPFLPAHYRQLLLQLLDVQRRRH